MGSHEQRERNVGRGRWHGILIQQRMSREIAELQQRQNEMLEIVRRKREGEEYEARLRCEEIWEDLVSMVGGVLDLDDEPG